MRRIIPSLAIAALLGAFAHAQTQPATQPVTNKELFALAEAWAERAAEYSAGVENLLTRELTISAAASVLADLGKWDRARDLMHEVREYKMSSFWANEALARAGNDDAAAMKAVAEIKDAEVRGEAANMLLHRFLENNDLKNALKTLEFQSDKKKADRGKYWIVVHLVKVDLLQEAAELAAKIEDKDDRRTVTLDVNLRRILFQKQGEGRKEFVRETAAAMGFTPEELDYALHRRAMQLAESGAIDAGIEIFSMTDPGLFKVWRTFDIAWLLTKSGRNKEALAWVAEGDKLARASEDTVTKMRVYLGYGIRIAAGDGEALLREFHALKAEERKDVETHYIRALLALGRKKEAAERILAITGERDRRLWGEEMALDGMLSEAEEVLMSLKLLDNKAFFCSGVGRGLVRRAEEKR